VPYTGKRHFLVLSECTRVAKLERMRIVCAGVSIGWGWTQTQEVTWPKMPWDHDNVVAMNHIRNIDGVMGDGGAVYTLGVQANRPFRQGAVKTYPVCRRSNAWCCWSV